MRKIIVAATFALCGVMSFAAQAQQSKELYSQPWILIGTSIVPTGIFSPTLKACHWKRSAYVNGIYTSEMTTTYTKPLRGCPAPSELN